VTYKVNLSHSAEKSLAKIPRRDREKIIEKIEGLQLEPRPEGYAKLKGYFNPSLYRIRHGDYRVVYTIRDEVLLVLVVEIGNRKEIYR